MDLAFISFFPNLQELYCDGQTSVKGSVRSLRDLQPNLTVLSLLDCSEVTGALSDLRDFPKLKLLRLRGTKVTPDVQNIGPNDFSSLSSRSDIGDPWLINDVPAFMRFLYERKLHDFRSTRSIQLDSPDFYIPNLSDLPAGDSRKALWRCPFNLEFVKVGPRVGWRWTTGRRRKYYFETNWLDPQPLPSDKGYSEYCEEVESKTKENLGPFRGLHDPPATKEEYKELATAFIRYPRAFARRVRPRTE